MKAGFASFSKECVVNLDVIHMVHKNLNIKCNYIIITFGGFSHEI